MQFLNRDLADERKEAIDKEKRRKRTLAHWLVPCAVKIQENSLFFLSFQTSPNEKEELSKKFSEEELEIRIRHNGKG